MNGTHFNTLPVGLITCDWEHPMSGEFECWEFVLVEDPGELRLDGEVTRAELCAFVADKLHEGWVAVPDA